ncbi:phosphonoacetaldehyde reductase [Paenibacillus yanchengensis]|uniref:Phosphonoacetaldehyde reductase n=1 Tax=Paenibacillus yanchengensis TaxID=2035833 RepID=A0ABW4YGU2_9BACL
MGRYFNPVESYFGVGELNRLGQILQSVSTPMQHILLITRGGNFAETAEHTILMEQLKDKQVQTLSVEIANPDVEDLYALLQQTGGKKFDAIVALGGGSVLDLGKSMAACNHLTFQHVEELRQAIISSSYLDNSHICPWVAIPTTAGTGSEVTPWATIWDRANGIKYSVDGKPLFARFAIIDPNLTLSLPVRTSIISGLDAICHATEAYWSKSTNVISRQFALEAIRLIVPNLAALYEDPTNVQLRTYVAQGSFFAGLAFSNTKTTACHSISYPITLLYGIDHGIAASMTLASMMEWNKAEIIEIDKLVAAFGVKNVADVADVIAAIYTKSGFSTRLRDYNVPQDGIVDIVERAYTKGRMDNNPRAITKEQLEQLLLTIY